jgi:hypothetical protein
LEALGSSSKFWVQLFSHMQNREKESSTMVAVQERIIELDARTGIQKFPYSHLKNYMKTYENMKLPLVLQDSLQLIILFSMFSGS